MAKRLEKTMVDYVTIAISPMLIMLLVGSLMFFLLETMLSGAQYGGMLKWTMFWFVIAIVLISRIGMEQGSAYAAGYGLALAGAVWLVAAKYSNAMVAAVVLGVVWWCANKLTWDCTLIEDTEDASGEGLLQVAGMAESTDDSVLSEADETKEADAKLDPDSGVTETVSEPTPWWQRVFLQRSERKNKPHAPGLWVVYFSMAALPLFGVGQLFLNSSDAAANDRVFRYLGTYVAAGLALLMTTSFLGLRRYLRQRKLEMPNSMVTRWLGMGAALIVAVLLIAMLIPRPQADYSITALLEKVGPEGLSASDYAMLPFDSGEGKGSAIGDPIDDGSQPDSGGSEGSGGESSGGEGDPQGSGGSKSGKGGSKSGGKSGKGGSDGGGKSGKGGSEKGEKSDGKSGENSDNDSTAGHEMDPSSGEAGENSDPGDSSTASKSQAGHESGDGESEDGQSGKEQSSSSSDVLSKAAGGIATLVKWLIYIAIFVVFCLLVKNNWAALLQGVKDFIKRLKAFWASLFGGKSEQRQTESEDGDQSAESGPIRKRFASYQNPFSNGDAGDMNAEELIRYTFEAFESWATERGVDRPPELTPLEFAKEVGEQELAAAQDANRTALLYTREAYSDHRPPRNYAETLEQLWRVMS